MAARVATKWRLQDHEPVAGPPTTLTDRDTSFRCDGSLLRPPAAGPPLLKRQKTPLTSTGNECFDRSTVAYGVPRKWYRRVAGQHVSPTKVQFRTILRPFQRCFGTSSISDDLQAPCSPSRMPEVDSSLLPESRTGTTVHQAAQRKASEEAKKKAAEEAQRQATGKKKEEGDARGGMYNRSSRSVDGRDVGSVITSSPHRRQPTTRRPEPAKDAIDRSWRCALYT